MPQEVKCLSWVRILSRIYSIPEAQQPKPFASAAYIFLLEKKGIKVKSQFGNPLSWSRILILTIPGIFQRM